MFGSDQFLREIREEAIILASVFRGSYDHSTGRLFAAIAMAWQRTVLSLTTPEGNLSQLHCKECGFQAAEE